MFRHYTLMAATLAMTVTWLGCGEVDELEPTGAGNQVSLLEARDLGGYSYGELAAGTVYPLLDQMQRDLEQFDKSTLPHEAKDLRKLVGRVRDHVDIFSYAYEYDADFDVWRSLRRDLDTGYERIGAFKDVFESADIDLAVRDPETGEWSDGVRPEDIDYDEDEVDARREPVREWKKKFLSDVRSSLYRLYARYANPYAIESRPKDSQSKFFWGGVAIEPIASRSGLENIGDLAGGLMELAVEDYQETRRLPDLMVHSSEEAFHDFRKRVRTVIKIHKYFPSAFESNVADAKTVDEIIDTLGKMVRRYGDVNNDLVAFHRAESQGESKKVRKKIARDVREGWQDVQQWQDDNAFDATLRQLVEILASRT